MLALIDADVAVYRVGFTTQADEEWVAFSRFDEMIEGILADTGASEFQLWLSDKTSNNFRTKFYPEYKANRKDFVLPKHYHTLKEHALRNWNAQIAIEQEADDALGIEQCQIHRASLEEQSTGESLPSETIICSIDKDLLQIPGNHYNFVRKEKQFVTPEQGLKCFYTQLLTGDTSDHIQGAPGIGSVKAAAGLRECFDEESMFHAVRNLYQRTYASRIYKCESLNKDQIQFVDDQILMNGICLKIRQQQEEIWNFPKLQVMGDTELSSTQQMQGETNPSTELGSAI